MSKLVGPAAFTYMTQHHSDASHLPVPNLGKVLQIIFLPLPFLPGIFFFKDVTSGKQPNTSKGVAEGMKAQLSKP